MSKNIGATLSIKDNNFTTGIKNAVSGTKDLKTHTTNATGSLKKMGNQGGKTGQSLASLAKKVVGVVAVYAGFRQIIRFGQDAIAAADGQYRAEARLEQLMMNVKGTTLANVEAVKKYASELQGLTTIGDEVAISGASQLATFALSGDSIKKLMPAMNDLAVGTYGVNVSQEQMIQTGNLVGKVMQGQIGALSRVGVTFSKQQGEILKTGTEAQRTATLIEVLNQNYGGLAQRMAQTPEGRIVQLKNAWGDVKEVVGMQLYPVVTSVLGWIASKIPAVQSIITGAIDKIRPVVIRIKNTAVSTFNNIKDAVMSNKEKFDELKPVIQGIGDNLKSAFEGAKPIINWIKDEALPGVIDIMGNAAYVIKTVSDNWEWIDPIVYGVAGAIGAYNIAVGINNALVS